ncbi:MAG: AAA family ATPase [Kineosporiaceae bacterium]|nr:AAA family ATPase [Kineosporiaceae bacterium]
MSTPSGRRRLPGNVLYLVIALGLIVAYAATTTLLWRSRDFVDDGPLSVDRPAATAALDPGLTLDQIRSSCIGIGRWSLDPGDSIKIVATREQGRAYYACYQLRRGSVWYALVVDGTGLKAPERVAKDLGAWRSIGLVKSTGEIIFGGAAVAGLLVMSWLYSRRPRPGPPVPTRWWQRRVTDGLLGTIGVLPLTLPFRRSESRSRRVGLFFRFVLGWSTVVVLSLFTLTGGDRLSQVTVGFLAAALIVGWLATRALVRAPGFGAPDGSSLAARSTPFPVAPVPVAPAPPWPASQSWAPAVPGSGAAPSAVVTATESADPARSRPRWVRPATGLPTFADVGGMEQLKTELSDTIGLLLAFSGEADRYRITFNGVLLYGPPGVGKTYIAKATAGEFGMSFAHISTGDLISKFVGESAANIRQLFAEAARNVPCLLFLDEFDAIASRRDAGQDDESRRVLTQLLQSIEEWRPVTELVVMAATNQVEALDPAIVRPGRFDRRIRVDLPDTPARQAIFSAQLRDRPCAGDVDVADLAQRTAGRTPAVIGRIVEAASLAAFRRAAAAGGSHPITQADLLSALTGLGGTDKPMIESWTWDRLVLAESTIAELKQIHALVADADRARAYGVDMPSGLLLAGPPGTGKTTIARVFAAQSGCSFYPITASDLTSMWVGESEANVVRLFERARENAPSIVFIDEIDAIGGRRTDTGGGVMDRVLTQVLTEMDGLVERSGVFVIGATNRPDMLDPALVRGGRLSRTLTIPLPDEAGRRRLLELFTARMPLQGVDLGVLARRAEGMSGADLEALCQQAALQAMVATENGGPAVVTPAAFAKALVDLRPELADGGAAAPSDPGHGTYL